jgi:uncharacterized membrane protein
MSDIPTHWHIKRNCSASPRQLALVLASLVAVSFVIGLGFAAYGLWMVLPFVGLEVIAVAAAFVCYGRHAADFERIDVENGELRVQRVDGSRHVECGWPAVWARVDVVEESGLLRHPHVFVGVREERVEVGRLLTDERRLQLAKELRQALRGAVA